ncbi:MAG: hypothetical protein E7586_04265 [Ruminococcaceae bacterium]|nr:hypothetical protein [Oscillospiraceae bacterium]
MKRFVSILCCLVMILVSIPISVSAEEKSIDYTEETVYINSYVSDLNGSYVLNTAEEQAEFVGLLGNYNPYVDEYFNALSQDFYATKSLIVVTSFTPCYFGYEFKVRNLIKQGSVITVKLDWWEIDLDQGKPEAIGCYATMIEVDKDVLDGVSSIDVIETDLRQDLAENPKFFKADDFPIEAFESKFDKGLLYIIDSAEKAEEFIALDISAGYNQPEVGDYFAEFPEDFFEEKVILTSVFYSGCPDRTYFNVRITKVDGVMTIVYGYNGPEEDRAYPTVPEYYINTVEMDKDLLNDVTKYSLIDRDHNQSLAIGFTGHVFDAPVTDFAEPVVVNSADELAVLVAKYDSAEFTAFAEGLADNYFDHKILVVAYEKEQYKNVCYTFDKIYNMGNYSDFTLYVDANMSGTTRGENGKLFVYEMSNDYENSSFYLCVNHLNWDLPFYNEDITIGLTSMSYLFLKRHYFNNYDFDEVQKRNADVNKNGEIDPMDYLIVKRCYFGQYAFS